MIIETILRTADSTIKEENTMISNQQKPINSGFGAKSEPTQVLADIDLSGKVAVVTGGIQA